MPAKPSIASVRASNNTASWTYRPTAVFVGGTSGIGEATARAFVSATKGRAQIIIVGRSRSRAEAIIESLPQSSDSSYEFIQCDVSEMKNVVETTKELRSKVVDRKINYLVLTPGIYPFGPYQPSMNGIDLRVVLDFYARWKFVDELMPLLENAAASGEEARILSAKNPFVDVDLDLEDLGFRRRHSPLALTKAGGVYNNMIVEEYSKLHQSLSFCHIFPGLVDTPGFKAAPWWTWPLVNLARLLVMASPEESGQRVLHTLLRPEFRNGAFYLDQYVSSAEAPRGNQEVRNMLLEHYKKEVTV